MYRFDNAPSGHKQDYLSNKESNLIYIADWLIDWF